jgi:DHA1 family multidrug resistance protein-like MFS transporter
MIEPIFALFIEEFQTGSAYLSTVTGGIFSIAGLFMVISAPWWGKRNDRLGYKRNLTIALAATGIVYAGHIIVTDLVQLGALRAILGFVRGGVLPTLYSLVSLFAPADRRGGMMAIGSSLTLFGNMLGPIIGGYVAAHFGIQTSFLVNSGMLLLMSLLLWRFLEESSSSNPPSKTEKAL